MLFNWKLVGIVSVASLVIALIAVIIGWQMVSSNSQISFSPTSPSNQPTNQDDNLVISKVSATGDIDDAINAILQAALLEDALLADEDNDADYYDYDAQAASDFGQANDEGQF